MCSDVFHQIKLEKTGLLENLKRIKKVNDLYTYMNSAVKAVNEV